MRRNRPNRLTAGRLVQLSPVAGEPAAVP